MKSIKMIAVCMFIATITACGSNATKEVKTTDSTVVDSTTCCTAVDTTKK